MIQANELKLGNIILVDGAYNTVSSIHSDATIRCFYGSTSRTHGCYSLDSDVIQPVPLTPEILEKAGFEKDRSGWWLPSTPFSLTDKFYPCWLDRMLWPQDLNEFKERKLEHLHQLQNIYHALTGKELEINL